jgi:aspartate-semialdehyde dehydrogenase
VNRGNLPTAVIVGATGAVGEDLRRLVGERDLPVGEVRLVASARSAGRRLDVRGEQIEVRALAPEVFDGAGLAFFSAGGGISREWAPVAAERGAVVVDNSSAWRLHPEVPLVDADVNPGAAADHPLGIVANPNCTTLAMTPVLAVLRDRFGLASITPTSFQAAGGSGQKGMDELVEQAAKLVGDRDLLRHGGRPEALPTGQVFPHPIAFNVVPQCMGFTDSGYTVEELKLRDEPRKILGLPELASHPTCVRVPVLVGHSLSVRAVCAEPVDLEAFRDGCAAAKGVTVVDDPGGDGYPTPLECAGTDGVFVGRIRADLEDPHAVLFWSVADNLRKGAALNAVQIAELLLRESLDRSDS